MVSVVAFNARPTATGVTRGVDVDVTVTITYDADPDLAPSRDELRGEVTLAPDHSGKYVAYGSTADTWVSGDLLNGLQRVMLRRAVARDDAQTVARKETWRPILREALDEIEAVASAACAEASS